MTFTPPPTPPNSGDPANFNDRADAFLAWMAQFASEIDAAGYPSIPLSLPNGTAAAPALAFASDTDTGIYRIGPNQLGVATGGTERARVTTNGLEVTGTIRGTGAQNLPALISAPSDTGVVTTAQRRAVLASATSQASGDHSTVAASRASTASGMFNAILASDNAATTSNLQATVASRAATIFGQISGVFASDNAEIESGAGRSAIIASDNGLLSQSRTSLLSTNQCRASQFGASVVSAQRTINDTARSLALGYAATGDPLTANRKIHLLSDTGNINIAGSLTSSHTFSDFAEMFPNATGVEIPLGTIVTEENGAVRPAGEGDEIAGVVTATAVVTAGDTPFAWQGRYLSDEWGQPIMAEIPDPDHEGAVPAPMISVQLENPEWNPDLPQTPRSERPADWTRVGLLGQVFTRVAEDVVPGDRLSAVVGIGVKSTTRTGLRCMTITQPYDAAKGYAVARCLINVQV